MQRLLEILEKKIPKVRAQVKRLKEFKEPIDELKIKHVLTGMRGLKVLNWTCGQVDSHRGILIRGVTLNDMLIHLPRFNSSPVPEAMLWFLLSGTVPKSSQLQEFIQDLKTRSELPEDTCKLMKSLPGHMPTLTKLSIGVMSLQPGSQFVQSYSKKVRKEELWRSALEDSLTIIARLPGLTTLALNAGEQIPYSDYGQTVARGLIGKDDIRLVELLRLVFVVMSESDGGSASAHASKAVGSALSDPFLSLSAGYSAIAGPRHGRASQDCMDWLIQLNQTLGYRPSDPMFVEALRVSIEKHQFLSGFGHAVLAVPDARCGIFCNYAQEIAPSDDYVYLADQCVRLGTEYLKKTGIRNPSPNVDLGLGVALHAMGVRDTSLYPTVFALGRTLGILANYVWDRAIMMPIEYGMSLDLADLEEIAGMRSEARSS